MVVDTWNVTAGLREVGKFISRRRRSGKNDPRQSSQMRQSRQKPGQCLSTKLFPETDISLYKESIRHAVVWTIQLAVVGLYTRESTTR